LPQDALPTDRGARGAGHFGAGGCAIEVLQILRVAFADTMRDPEFVSDAKRSKLEIDPLNGEELTRVVQELFKLDPAIATRLRGILK
jgi:hypothetical protein